jgi:hypothetical protein
LGVAVLHSSTGVVASKIARHSDKHDFPEFPTMPGSLCRAQRWLAAPRTGNLKLGLTKQPGTSHILLTVLQKRGQVRGWW